MEKIELKDAFAEFKNQKNIDRATKIGRASCRERVSACV